MLNAILKEIIASKINFALTLKNLFWNLKLNVQNITENYLHNNNDTLKF
jgi:hypothetical protein